MVVVPVLMLRVELLIPLCQRSHAPRINEFLPCAAGYILFEFIVVHQIEAIELIRTELNVRGTVCIKMIIYHVFFLVAEVLFEATGKHLCESAPLLG